MTISKEIQDLEDTVNGNLKDSDLTDFYYDNPGAAVDDIKYLNSKILELIKIIKDA